MALFSKKTTKRAVKKSEPALAATQLKTLTISVTLDYVASAKQLEGLKSEAEIINALLANAKRQWADQCGNLNLGDVTITTATVTE